MKIHFDNGEIIIIKSITRKEFIEKVSSFRIPTNQTTYIPVTFDDITINIAKINYIEDLESEVK